MRISLNVATLPSDDPAGRLAEVAAAADRAGVDTLWIPDHLQQVVPGRRVDEPVFETYQALGWLAGLTDRVRLGAMVTSVALRPLVLTVKLVTDLDVLSRGRAWFGVGAGYRSAENDHLALALPPLRERFDLLEDAVRLARHVWSGSTEPFSGHVLEMPDPVLRPRPVTAGGPPVLIGGAGETRTLRLVARHADACNLFDMPPEALRHKLNVLAAHLREAGRSAREVERTISVRWSGDDTQGFLDHLAELEALGFDHAVVLRDTDWTAGDVERLMTAADV